MEEDNNILEEQAEESKAEQGLLMQHQSLLVLTNLEILLHLM